MNTLALPDVLKTIHSLPALPAVVMDLLASMADAEPDIETLAGKIARDQTLTAKTLRVANSSFYGMQRQVATIPEAIAVLGLHTVRNLASTAAVMRALASGGSSAFDFAAFWRHAIRTAVCARALAARIGQCQGQSYIAGLLHDIGGLVLATQFPAHYAAVQVERRRHEYTTIEAERAVLGLDHALIGEALARHWKFPDLIQFAVARHHDPYMAAGETMTLMVHAADAVAHALDTPGPDGVPQPSVDAGIWKSLGLDEASLQQVFTDAEKQFQAAAALTT